MLDRAEPQELDVDALAERLGTPPAAPLAMPKQALDTTEGLPPAPEPLPHDARQTLYIRTAALTFSVVAAAGAFLLFLQFGAADGLDALDWVRSLLILVTTWWLAWGAAQAMAGLWPMQAGPRPRIDGPITARTVVIVPVYNEDPVATFARVAAMDASLAATGFGDRFSIAILSDTRDAAVAAQERRWFLRLLSDCDGEGRIFYRRRERNTGRKAGNIEEFIAASGAAWDHALILDADSLMEGATIVEMVRRMEAQPDLGLLQTLPRVIRAKAWFARSMQFSAALYAPVFARGLARMQGRTGPFWGHNALVRMRAFAESCGLPELPGRAPFGGHILSHDYVEAAMLARAGWRVRLDEDLEGSYEEGPETILDHAKRDRRWCQGNLQHAGVMGAAGLKGWSRFVFVQGIFAYASALLWLAYLAASLIAPVVTGPVEFFEPENPVPIFPSVETSKAIALAIGVFGLLFLPKLLIAAEAVLTGRARGFGGGARVMRGALAEILLSSLTAPIHLMYQTRSVLQVLLGRDSGWPAQDREGARLSIATCWQAAGWITIWGVIGLTVAIVWALGVLLWVLPIALPMIAAPLLISGLSHRGGREVFATPSDLMPSEVIRRHGRILRRWRGEPAPAAVAVAQDNAAAPALGVPAAGA